MGPRKSGASMTSNGVADQSMTEAPPTPQKATKEGVGIDDLTLPKSMIARLAKGVLPANTQIQKDALLALHKSATVFVSYLANASNEITLGNMKKTIMPQDVITAIKDTEFEAFLPRLQAELKKYNDIQCDKRNSYRHRVKQEKAAAAAATSTDNPDAINGAADGDVSMSTSEPTGDLTSITNADDEPPTKKLKGAEGEMLPPPTGSSLNGAPSAMVPLDDTEQNIEDDLEDDDDESDNDSFQSIEDEQIEDEDDEAEAPDTMINPDGMRDEALDEPDSD